MSKRTPTLSELIERRLSRRGALAGFAASAAAASLPLAPTRARAADGPSSLTFSEISHTLDPQQHVAPGYDPQVLIRWGDPVVPGAPAFDPMAQSAAAQEKQFGYNNDYLGLYPVTPGGAGGDRFLLVANHEYTNADLMFAGLGSGREASLKVSAAQAAIEMAAMGGSGMAWS